MAKKEMGAPKRDVIGEQIELVISKNRGTGGITGRIANAARVLNQGQVKAALMMTDREKLAREHQIVVGTAEKCVADKENCPAICKEGAQQLLARITTEYDDTSLEGLGEYLTPSKGVENMTENAPVETEKTDEELKELYESCDVCHVADAAVKFAKIAEKDECDGVKVMEKLQPCLDNQKTAPETWLKTMTEVTEQATCNKSEYGQALGELTEYLQRKDSEILKNLDKAKY